MVMMIGDDPVAVGEQRGGNGAAQTPGTTGDQCDRLVWRGV